LIFLELWCCKSDVYAGQLCNSVHCWCPHRFFWSQRISILLSPSMITSANGSTLQSYRLTWSMREQIE
jgi:hypothetical protein